MLTDFSKTLNINLIKKILLYLFIAFPVFILSGNLLINVFVYLISLLFIFLILFKKVNFNYKNKIFYLQCFFFLSLVINLIFSDNIGLSTPRVFKSFFIIFFIFAFKYIFDQLPQEKFNLIYKSWSLIFLIMLLDLILEFFTQKNIFGFQSSMPGRLVSFAGSESNIGYFFSGFSLIFLTYIYKKYPDKFFLNFLFVILVVILSFLIGERSNFFKTLFIVILYYLIIYKKNFKIKILPVILIISFFSISANEIKENIVKWKVTEDNSQYYGYKSRYFNQLKEFFNKDGIKNYLENTQYGAHYEIAKQITKKNPFFGVGIKNFRVESFKSDYVLDGDHKLKSWGGNTHPHQIHYEFLSETGLFGYSSFIFFILCSIYLSIKNYLKYKNPYQLCGILFVISTLIPLLPSGSFFSTYSSSIFWINYSIMVGYIKIKT